MRMELVNTKKAQYRQRVYQLDDGTIVLVYGCDEAPSNGKILADHDIVELVTVTDHVEDVATYK